MTSTLLNTNARLPRKSLNDPIDRLDGILDGLAEALNESVADAVKQAVTQVVKFAVETSIKEVLTNPALHQATARMITPVPDSASTPAPSPRRRMRDILQGFLLAASPLSGRTQGNMIQGLTHIRSWALQSCRRRLAQRVQSTGVLFRGIICLGKILRQHWLHLGLTLGVGAATALLAYQAGPVLASGLCGLCGALLTGMSGLLRAG